MGSCATGSEGSIPGNVMALSSGNDSISGAGAGMSNAASSRNNSSASSSCLVRAAGAGADGAMGDAMGPCATTGARDSDTGDAARVGCAPSISMAANFSSGRASASMPQGSSSSTSLCTGAVSGTSTWLSVGASTSVGISMSIGPTGNGGKASSACTWGLAWSSSEKTTSNKPK